MACSLLNFLMAEIYGSRKHFGICFNSSNPLISNLKWQTRIFIWKLVFRDKTEDTSDYIATNNSEKILTPLDSRQSNSRLFHVRHNQQNKRRREHFFSEEIMNIAETT